MNGRDPNGYDRDGWPALGFAAFAILVVWMLVLPWIQSRHALSVRIDELDRRRIDPTALYYTDLEAMEGLEANITSIRRAHPDAFWTIRADAAK